MIREYAGRCGCGATRVTLYSELAPEAFQPRSDAQSCGFCRQHAGIWISDPRGSLVIAASNPTRTQQFATAQVQFHFCAACDELAYAIYADGADRTVAVVRRDLFASIAASAQPVISTNFEGEPEADARQRRLRNWTVARVG